jgi:hypothetical protein
MKAIFIISLMAFSLLANAQSIGNDRNNQGSTITATSKLNSTAVASSGNIATQISTWKTHVQANPKDANAWVNYYNWMDRDKSLTAAQKQFELKSIYNQSQESIAGTWQQNLIKFLQSEKRDSASLFAALRLSYSNPSLYPYAVQYAIIANDDDLTRLYSKAANDAAPLSAGLYEYHYNTLMSAEQNGIIYAKGLNDLVPLAILQNVYDVRKDVELKYYEGKATESNAYLSLSLGKDVLQQYPQAAYTGLLAKVNAGAGAENEDHLSKDFSLKTLKSIGSLTEEEKLICRNYLPSFIILYKDYKARNDVHVAEWKEIIEKLALLTGTSESVNNILAK